jgi:hypothetical protein
MVQHNKAVLVKAASRGIGRATALAPAGWITGASMPVDGGSTL